MADGFRPHVPYAVKYNGRNLFLEAAEEKIGQTAKYFYNAAPSTINPQTPFFHCHVPVALAPQANLGLSIYPEGRKHFKFSSKVFAEGILCLQAMDSKTQKRLDVLFKQLDILFLIIWLNRNELLKEEIELYLLVEASRIDPYQIVTLDKLLQLILLFSHLFPWEHMPLNPMKQALFRKLVGIKMKYEKKMHAVEGHKLQPLAESFTADCIKLFQSLNYFMK